jgi:hypothetical protein
VLSFSLFVNCFDYFILVNMFITIPVHLFNTIARTDDDCALEIKPVCSIRRCDGCCAGAETSNPPLVGS